LQGPDMSGLCVSFIVKFLQFLP